MQLVNSSFVNGTAFPPLFSAWNFMNTALYATSLAQLPHMSVMIWSRPLGATLMKASLSVCGHETSGAMPSAGRLISAFVHSSDFAAASRAGWL